jgi:hypothetical protein
MFGTIEPRLIALLNTDPPSDNHKPYPRLDLPPLQDPNILKASGRPSPLEPGASRTNKHSALSRKGGLFESDGVHGRIKTQTSEKGGLGEKSVGSTSSQSLRKILADDTEPVLVPPRKRQRIGTGKDDFVQLPQLPAKKHKTIKQVVPPIIIGLHSLPPNQTTLFPPIASSSFHDSHGRNSLNTAPLIEPKEDSVSRPPLKELGKLIGAKVVNIKKASKVARNKWTEEETQHMLLGVKKHGIGNWKRILEDPEFAFNNRKAVDIKDRFRTCCPAEFQSKKKKGDKADKAGPSDFDSPMMPRSKAVSISGIVTPENGSNSCDEFSAEDRVPSSPKLEHKTRAHRKRPEDLKKLGIEKPFVKSKRRERRPFTEEEDRNILRGFEIYGQSSWTIIQRDPRFRLESRKPTDLRDRFRNRYPEKYFVEDESKNGKKRPLSSKNSIEALPNSSNPSSQTQEVTSSQEKIQPISIPSIMPSMLNNKPTAKPQSQLPVSTFNFKESFTEMLGPLPIPINDSSDNFSFSQPFEWSDSVAPFTNEMDISRLLLDETWPSDPNMQVKNKYSSNLVTSMAPPLSQLVPSYHITLSAPFDSSSSGNFTMPVRRGQG